MASSNQIQQIQLHLSYEVLLPRSVLISSLLTLIILFFVIVGVNVDQRNTSFSIIFVDERYVENFELFNLNPFNICEITKMVGT